MVFLIFRQFGDRFDYLGKFKGHFRVELPGKEYMAERVQGDNNCGAFADQRRLGVEQ